MDDCWICLSAFICHWPQFQNLLVYSKFSWSCLFLRYCNQYVKFYMVYIMIVSCYVCLAGFIIPKIHFHGSLDFAKRFFSQILLANQLYLILGIVLRCDVYLTFTFKTFHIRFRYDQKSNDTFQHVHTCLIFIFIIMLLQNFIVNRSVWLDEVAFNLGNHW